MYSNAQILAAVVSEWVRPAIAQIAADRIGRLPFMQNLQRQIQSIGIAGQNYCIANDVAPLVQPVINSMVQPWLEEYFSRLPDKGIPDMARKALEAMKEQGTYTILDGCVTFDADDIDNLATLIEKNLPAAGHHGYEVKH